MGRPKRDTTTPSRLSPYLECSRRRPRCRQRWPPAPTAAPTCRTAPSGSRARVARTVGRAGRSSPGFQAVAVARTSAALEYERCRVNGQQERQERGADGGVFQHFTLRGLVVRASGRDTPLRGEERRGEMTSAMLLRKCGALFLHLPGDDLLESAAPSPNIVAASHTCYSVYRQTCGQTKLRWT